MTDLLSNPVNVALVCILALPLLALAVVPAVIRMSPALVAVVVTIAGLVLAGAAGAIIALLLFIAIFVTTNSGKNNIGK